MRGPLALTSAPDSGARQYLSPEIEKTRRKQISQNLTVTPGSDGDAEHADKIVPVR